MAEIAKLKGKRHVYRRHLKNIEDEMIQILNEVRDLSINEAKDELDIKLKGMRDSYKEKVNVVASLDDEIVNSIKSQEELEDELADTLVRSDKYHMQITLFEHHLVKLQGDNLSDSSNDTKRNIPSMIARNTSIKLPVLELTKFDGNVLHWINFWDRFKSSIDSNVYISDVEKFNYLLSFLSESAKSSICGLTLTSANYARAKDILMERFANPQVIISAYMDSLVKLSPVKHMNNISQLRKMYDDIESSIRNLKGLGINPESYGALLIPVLTEKLPEEMRMIIARKFIDEMWDLEKLLEYFKDELQAKERCSSITLHAEENDKHSPHKSLPYKYDKKLFTTASFFNESKGTCVYCREVHPPSQCVKVTEVKARRAILRKYARCFICLKRGHISRNCESQYKCNKCSQRHHISLCDDGQRDDRQDHTVTNFTDNRNNILLQTALGKATSVGKDSYRKVRLMFDSGSQRTYVTEELKELLKLPSIRTEKLIMQTFGNTNSEARIVDIVQLKIRGKNEYNDIYVEAICIPIICSPLRNQIIDVSECGYEHLIGLNLSDYHDGKESLSVDILVGLDFYHSFMRSEVRMGENGPVAQNSIFGWVLCGRYEVRDKSEMLSAVYFNTTHCLKVEARYDTRSSVMHKSCSSSDMRHNEVKIDAVGESDKHCLNELLSKFYEIESLGINDECSVINEFQRNLSFDGKRYICKLPLKPYHDVIPDNHRNALKRLYALKAKLSKDDMLCSTYDNIIREYQKKGIIEIVDDNLSEAGKVHYLPHHAVVRDDKETTKVRIVFDASSRSGKEASLNECLYSGPCLLPSIFDILLRFRMGSIGIVSDIEKAFLNIGIAKEHSDLLRFLWFKDIHSSNEILTFRFNRVVFGLTSSPFLLNGTIAYHLSKYMGHDQVGDIISQFKRDLYVDDCTVSMNSVEKAVSFVKNSKQIMAEGGFKLRKWDTNNTQLKQFISDEDEDLLKVEDNTSYAKNELGVSRVYRKVLGINWDTNTDELVFAMKQTGINGLRLKYTKRNILSICASYFDPLGLICPVVLQAKLLFKRLCTMKTDWDDLVPEDMRYRWHKYLSDLTESSDLRIPRFIYERNDSSIVSVELHGFADSSKEAGAAVVYIRAIRSDGSVTTNIASAKSKIAPMKITSIPRLELIACVLLSKLITALKKALYPTISFNRVLCWSDSEIALYWIKGIRKEWKAWVENRVTAIRDNVNCDNWRYVSSDLNPADLATREGLISEVINDKWWSGPNFLKQAENEWPVQKEFALKKSVEVLSEMRNIDEFSIAYTQADTVVLETEIVTETVQKLDVDVQSVIDVRRFNSFVKLCWVMAYVFRFLNNLRNSVRGTMDAMQKDELTLEEINNAKRLFLKCAQNEFGQNGNDKQLNASLRLYKDEFGLLRSRTRLGEATDIELDVRFPIVLPSDNHITKTIILDAHAEVVHSSVDSTLNQVRLRYWILKGRQTVSKVIKGCNLCKLWRMKRLKATPLSNLPAYRVCSEYAFQSTGIDFAGPMFTKNVFGDNNQLHKCYILLFTCATTRGIHLELTPDMSATTLILAIKRFVSRKGYPQKFISDNFKTFKSSALQTFLKKNEIEWRFILELSPWWGGFYERMVKVVKYALRKILKNAKLTYDELTTVLVEIECMINARPLTYMSDENVEAITPFHLMYGRNISVHGDQTIKLYHNNFRGKLLKDRLDYLKLLLEQYWKRFYHEYTTALRERIIYDKTERVLPKLVVGDVVIITDDKMKSVYWKRGRILELISGRDDIIRGVKLQSTSAEGKIVYIRRPIQKIIPLEISSTDNNEEIKVRKMIEGDDLENNDAINLRAVPKRNAAIAGELKRRFRSKYL